MNINRVEVLKGHIEITPAAAERFGEWAGNLKVWDFEDRVWMGASKASLSDFKLYCIPDPKLKRVSEITIPAPDGYTILTYEEAKKYDDAECVLKAHDHESSTWRLNSHDDIDDYILYAAPWEGA